AVAARRLLHDVAARRLDAYGRARLDGGTTDEREVDELPHVVRRSHLVGDDGLDVGVRDLDLSVRKILEALERALDLLARELVAHLLELGGERVASGMLSEDDLAAL